MLHCISSCSLEMSIVSSMYGTGFNRCGCRSHALWLRAELALHVCASPEGIQACFARRRKRRGHAETAVLVDNDTSSWPVAIEEVLPGISNVGCKL